MRRIKHGHGNSSSFKLDSLIGDQINIVGIAVFEAEIDLPKPGIRNRPSACLRALRHVEPHVRHPFQRFKCRCRVKNSQKPPNSHQMARLQPDAVAFRVKAFKTGMFECSNHAKSSQQSDICQLTDVLVCGVSTGNALMSLNLIQQFPPRGRCKIGGAGLFPPTGRMVNRFKQPEIKRDIDPC